MEFLQVQTANGSVSKGIDLLFQYGVLGLFALIMILIIRYMEKQRVTREQKAEELRVQREMDLKEENKELKGRIKSLEDRFEDYENNDRHRMESLIEKCTDVMEDVKGYLRGVMK